MRVSNGFVKYVMATIQVALGFELFLVTIGRRTRTAVDSTATVATTTAGLMAITAIVARLPGNRSAQRKRCSRNSQQRILLTERSRQMLRSKAKSPSERKEPPTPKKPPIKEPKKVQKPIGDPPPKRAPKRVALYRDFQDSIWQSI